MMKYEQSTKAKHYSLKRILLLTLMVMVFTTIWSSKEGHALAIPSGTGATFMTDTDNWGGGDPNSEADGDMGVNIKNSTSQSSADPRYPIEFKIDVQQVPQKSAYLLIRAYDVDEYNRENNSLGEWIRTYFSGNPADIALREMTNPYPISSATDYYKREMAASAYRGALVGGNEIWSTTVMPFTPAQLPQFTIGDYYVGLTIHHYYLANSPFNSGWSGKVDWGQLVIDGGSRDTAEFRDVAVSVSKGKIIVDPSFLVKTLGQYAMEVHVVEEIVEPDQSIFHQYRGAAYHLFENVQEGTIVGETQKQLLTVSNPAIDVDKTYTVNIILYEDRGGGGLTAQQYTNPGKVQHLISVSTDDMTVQNIDKQLDQSGSVHFAKEEFKQSSVTVVGKEVGERLEKIKIVSLPDSTVGRLQLNGSDTMLDDEIAVNDLDMLAYVVNDTNEAGLHTTASFAWDGFDGAAYTDIPAIVTIFGTPVADQKTIVVDEGQDLISIIGTGIYDGTDTAISYGSLVDHPSKGSVIVDEANMQFDYTPDSSFHSGTDSFTYTVKNVYGIESEPATVTIHIEKAFNGWVGDKAEKDPTVIAMKLGDSLLIQAISSHLADSVNAFIDGQVIPLDWTNEPTWEVDGFKQWEYSYMIPTSLTSDTYTVTFQALDDENNVSQVEADLTDNKFSIAKPVVYPPYVPERVQLDIAISANKQTVKPEERVTITLDYHNPSAVAVSNGILTMAIPEGASIVDAAGAAETNGMLTWQLGAIPASSSKQIQVVLEWKAQEISETTTYTIASTFAADQAAAQPATQAKAETKVNVTAAAGGKGDEGQNGNDNGTTEETDNGSDIDNKQPYMTGTADGMFYPEKTLTRAELAVIMNRLSKTNKSISTEQPAFIDVPQQHWAYTSINEATANGYFSNNTQGVFRPNDAVTRAELATVIGRYLALTVNHAVEAETTLDTNPYFRDMNGHWSSGIVAKLYEAKIVGGYDDRTFQPNRKVSRAEAVTMLNRMLGRSPVAGMEAQFSDVPTTHWAFAEIQAASTYAVVSEED